MEYSIEDNISKNILNYLQQNELSNRLYVQSFINSDILYIILIFKNKIKIVKHDLNSNSFVIDNDVYLITQHFLERYIERFNILTCNRYSIYEMIAKELLFLHSYKKEYKLEHKDSKNIKSRYGNICIKVSVKKKFTIYRCLTFLNFTRKYQKRIPQIEWFDSF